MTIRLQAFLFSIIIFYSCKKDVVIPSYYYLPNAGQYSLYTQINNKLPTPDIKNFPVPTAGITCLSAAVRNGTTNIPIGATITGSLMSEIPQDISNLICLNNRPLSNLQPNDTIKGWLVTNVFYVSLYDGSISDVTTILNASLEASVSGVLTYFPDGYYTFVSSVDPARNSMGYYQISMSGNIPWGLVYIPKASGSIFNAPPLNPGPIQGYGIWGLTPSSYFPLFQIDRSDFVILKGTPFAYIKQ